MKAIYVKPTVEILSYQDELMISTSVNGTTIIEDGGNTGDAGITSGDARHYDCWGDEEEW